jgi:hypothetical protein
MKKARSRICKTDPSVTLMDVLDRVLDKGVIIEAWIRVPLVGIDLIAVDARVLVASIHTYVRYSSMIAHTGMVARPQPNTSASPTARPAARRASRPEAPPAAAPPARRASRAARPAPARRRPRKVAVRCQQGCTLTAPPGLLPCPFKADRSCELRAV